MSSDLTRVIVEDFLSRSWASIEAVVTAAASSEGRGEHFRFFRMEDGKARYVDLDDEHFFLRSSVEYSNPQLTVEEVQGVIAARLLEVTGNYFGLVGLHKPAPSEIEDICSLVSKPAYGRIVSFLLNTDDVEPDRYSMNPLKASIVNSGQSAFPSAHVKNEGLEVDPSFAAKYSGSLISEGEIEMIERHIKLGDSYLDMVDSVKYDHLEILSETFGIDLLLPAMRLPISRLSVEDQDGLLHSIISETHRNYESVEKVYSCMGRSMSKRTTLLTIPHSSRGFGSKRAARGRVYFEGQKLKSVKVTYRSTTLYPNAIDPQDISVADCNDIFAVEGDKLSSYVFADTPSSPQFILYTLVSPEGAAIWHGVGEFGSTQLVKSYSSTRRACAAGSMLNHLSERGLHSKVPVQFNIPPEGEWYHPVHDNIDASIGCVEDLSSLARMGIRLDYFSTLDESEPETEK